MAGHESGEGSSGSERKDEGYSSAELSMEVSEADVEGGEPVSDDSGPVEGPVETEQEKQEEEEQANSDSHSSNHENLGNSNLLEEHTQNVPMEVSESNGEAGPVETEVDKQEEEKVDLDSHSIIRENQDNANLLEKPTQNVSMEVSESNVEGGKPACDGSGPVEVPVEAEQGKQEEEEQANSDSPSSNRENQDSSNLLEERTQNASVDVSESNVEGGEPASDDSGAAETEQDKQEEEEQENSDSHSSNRENQDNSNLLEEPTVVTTTESSPDRKENRVVEGHPSSTEGEEMPPELRQLSSDQEEGSDPPVDANSVEEINQTHTGLRSVCSSKPDPPSVLDDSILSDDQDEFLDPLLQKDSLDEPEETIIRETAELLMDLSEGLEQPHQHHHHRHPLPPPAGHDEKKTADGYGTAEPSRDGRVMDENENENEADQRGKVIVRHGSSPDHTTSTLGVHDPADGPIAPRVLSPDAPTADERLSATGKVAPRKLGRDVSESSETKSPISQQRSLQPAPDLNVELSDSSYHSLTGAAATAPPPPPPPLVAPPITDVASSSFSPPPPATFTESSVHGLDDNSELLTAVEGNRLSELSALSATAPVPRVLLSSPVAALPPPPPPLLQQQQQQQRHQQPPMHQPATHHHAVAAPPAPGAFPPVAFSSIPHHPHHPHHVAAPPLPAGGRRKIRLRLQEEVSKAAVAPPSLKRAFLGKFQRSSRHMFGNHSPSPSDTPAAISSIDSKSSNHAATTTMVDRGTISVSWFEGTGSLELHEHVRKTVYRKLKLDKDKHELVDMRVVDETMDPPEEIVLSPFIPNGSEFLLQFSLHDTSSADGARTPISQHSSVRAPVSPSAAPSPYPERKHLLNSLNPNQLALLKLPTTSGSGDTKSPITRKHHRRGDKKTGDANRLSKAAPAAGAPARTTKDGSSGNQKALDRQGSKVQQRKSSAERAEEDDNSSNDFSDSMGEEDDDDMMLHSEDPIEARLRHITELLLHDRQKKSGESSSRRREKRQVVFVLANYFVLFLSFIAISAEIQARAPGWLSRLESHLKDVQDCAADQEALFQCVSNGDFAGLVASIIIWLTRSVATHRIFLFGFDTREKLWTVVYESFVTAFCWGVSYMFIRRGLNPDTRPRFLQKYWKDAVYGSLAGFNAAFLKQVLKNLIPQEAVEEAVQDALRDRPLSILRWLGPSLQD